MTDDVLRLSVVGRIVRRRWRSLAALAIVGALLGAGASLLFSPGYRTASDVLLQGPRDEGELVTEAQVAQSSVVLSRTAAVLGWGRTGAELRDSVQADVLEGNVVRISGTADTPERAKRLTDTLVAEYVAFSTQLLTNPTDSSAQLMQERQAALMEQVLTTNRRIDDLHKAASNNRLTLEGVQARTRLESLRAELSGAVKGLQEAQATSSRVGMAVMGDAPLPASPAPPTLMQLSVGGGVLFLLAGILLHLAAGRTGRVLTDERDITVALGAPVLGDVAVPVGGSAGRKLRLRRRPASAPADEDVRYRRILARAGQTPDEPLRLQIVVADGDEAALLAVKHLATSTEPPSELRVAGVSADRPTVPEYPGSAGALVVLTARTRTSVELMAIADACADAGLPVVGAVVVHPAASTGTEPRDGPAEARVRDEAMAGRS